MKLIHDGINNYVFIYKGKTMLITGFDLRQASDLFNKTAQEHDALYKQTADDMPPSESIYVSE